MCPQCSSLDVGYSGFGTQRVEEELAAALPGLRVRRLDTDAARNRRELRTALAQFRAGEVDVLVGTQMVAKGLDFPGVRLVGIINADTGLHLPDFRAAERTFNLIVQVSGRAGRTLPDGRVLVQTYLADQYAIRLAVQGRAEEFYRREVELRRELRFPPFVRLIRIVIRSRSKQRAHAAAGSFAEQLQRRRGAATGEVLGPVECPIERIAGNYRCHMLLRHTTLGPAARLGAAHLPRVPGAGRSPPGGGRRSHLRAVTRQPLPALPAPPHAPGTQHVWQLRCGAAIMPPFMFAIVTLGHPALRRRADPIPEVTPEVRRLAGEMIAAMKQREGIGLAATQVNRMVRMFVTKAPDDRERVFINPEIIRTGIETEVREEGCLSIPGPRADVERAAQVRIQARNQRGRLFSIEAQGMLARVIQHELDHLNGVLFIDHLSEAERARVLREYAERGAQSDAEDRS